MLGKTIGIAFIVIGIVMIAYNGFNYVTTKKVVDLGSIQIEKKEVHPIQWSPIVGVIFFIGGIAIISLKPKKSIEY
jgi:uncharacterized membrane protein YdcZ (DUF606 family)